MNFRVRVRVRPFSRCFTPFRFLFHAGRVFCDNVCVGFSSIEFGKLLRINKKKRNCSGRKTKFTSRSCTCRRDKRLVSEVQYGKHQALKNKKHSSLSLCDCVPSVRRRRPKDHNDHNNDQHRFLSVCVCVYVCICVCDRENYC